MTPEDIEAARSIASNPELNEILYLCKCGVPFDVAASLSRVERYGWFVICGELGGGEFDWSTQRWRARE